MVCIEVLVVVGMDMDSRLAGRDWQRRAVAVVILWSMVSVVGPDKGSRDAGDEVRAEFSVVFDSGQMAG